MGIVYPKSQRAAQAAQKFNKDSVTVFASLPQLPFNSVVFPAKETTMHKLLVPFDSSE